MNVATMKATTSRRRLLIAVIVVAGLWLSAACGSTNAQLVHESISQPLGTAERANVEIALRVGQLRIGALDQPSELIRGDIAYQAQHRVVRDFAVSDDTASFSLREQDSQRLEYRHGSRSRNRR